VASSDVYQAAVCIAWALDPTFLLRVRREAVPVQGGTGVAAHGVAAQVEIKKQILKAINRVLASSAEIKRGQPGVNLGSTWGQSGVNLGSTWGRPGVDLHRPTMENPSIPALPKAPSSRFNMGGRRSAPNFDS